MNLALDHTIRTNLTFNEAGVPINPDELGKDLQEIYHINFTALNEVIEGLKEIFAKQPKLDYLPEIHLSVSDSYRIDAYAGFLAPTDPQWDKHYLINIYYGVFVNFYSLFWGLLSNPKIIPEIYSDEEIPNFLYNKGLLDYCYNFSQASNQMEDFGKTFVTHFYPEHRDRQVYSQLLANLCIEFLFMHELSHVLGGHIGYMVHHQNMDLQGLFHFQPSRLGMAAWEAPTGIPNIKLFEFDADFIAGGLMAGILKHDRSLLGKYLEQDISQPHDLYKALALAILVLFHLFQEIRNTYREEQPYPEPDIRFWAAYWGITSTLRSNGGDEAVYRFEEGFQWAIKQYLGILDVLQLPNVFPFLTQHHNKAQEEVVAMDAALQELSHLLRPYSVWRQGNS